MNKSDRGWEKVEDPVQQAVKEDYVLFFLPATILVILGGGFFVGGTVTTLYYSFLLYALILASWFVGSLLVYLLLGDLFCFNKRIKPFIKLNKQIKDRGYRKEVLITLSHFRLFLLMMFGIVFVPLYKVWCSNYKYEHMGDDPRKGRIN